MAPYKQLADIVFLVHFLFIVFVVFGGLLVLRWKRVAWLHLPALIWGVAIEFFGWICPLTPLEIWLRAKAGWVPYTGGFIQHYIEPIIYPPGLTRRTQIILGVVLISANAVIYIFLWLRGRRKYYRMLM